MTKTVWRNADAMFGNHWRKFRHWVRDRSDLRADGYQSRQYRAAFARDSGGVINLAGDLADPNFLPTIAEHLRAAVADADSLCLVHNAARLGHDTVQDIETDALRQIDGGETSCGTCGAQPLAVALPSDKRP